MRSSYFVAAAVAMAALLISSEVLASGAATGLQWESPFQAFRNSITGPIAFGISFLGICGCGFVLIWGGEINEFVRRAVMLILVVALIMFANNILTTLFAGGASVVTPPMAEMPAAESSL